MIIYGLMKFIEQIPERYDRMIGFLTLGGHNTARDLMLQAIKPGMKVLDIGCGTGSFLIEAAKRGAICTGIDASASMLKVFRDKIHSDPLAKHITIHNQSATLMSRTFANQTFDIITTSLMLGELPELVLSEVLRQIPGLLAEQGRFFVCDELWPEDKTRSLLYSFILAITFVPNFILTRTMIRPVKGLSEKIGKTGLKVVSRQDFTLGVVSLLEARQPS